MPSPCFRSLAGAEVQELITLLQDRAENGLLPFSAQREAAERYSLSLAEIEDLSLAHGILPARYQRNLNMISVRQQLVLCRSKVAVIGCGGLGGYIIEELARLGVGTIVAVDPDVFAEHNLNRQLFCTPEQLGQTKVSVAARRVREVNPAVRFQAIAEAFDRGNGPAVLQGVDVVADALDSIPARLTLAGMCHQLAIPLVHGAIAGWYGHLAVQFPGDKTLAHIYSHEGAPQGIETALGNPSFTPALVASLEVAEIVKIIVQTGEPLRNRYLVLDLYHMEINAVPLDGKE